MNPLIIRDVVMEVRTLRKIIEDLVEQINIANAPDALDGYHDGMADDVNERLEASGLPTINKAGE